MKKAISFFGFILYFIIISGYGFGSLMWIPLETAFINPDNKSPVTLSHCLDNQTDSDMEDVCQEVEDQDKYFIDEDVLKR